MTVNYAKNGSNGQILACLVLALAPDLGNGQFFGDLQLSYQPYSSECCILNEALCVLLRVALFVGYGKPTKDFMLPFEPRSRKEVRQTQKCRFHLHRSIRVF